MAGKNAESLGIDDENNTKRNVEQNFHAMSKAWRKQVNFLNTQVVSNCEITHLQNECRALERCMLDLTQAYEVLESVIESPVEKIVLYGKFEDMSRENNALVKQVHEAIRDLRADRGDKSSVLSRRTSRSVVSRKSAKSVLSRASRASTSSSTHQRRQDLEEEAAILKTKFRLAQEKEKLDQTNRQALEEIQEKLLEIKRQEMRVKEQIQASKESFKIKEELAETEARIEVCAKYEEEEGAHDLLDDVSCDDGSQEHIQKFLDSQEIAISTEQRTDEIPLDINASTQDNRVNDARQDKEASGIDLNPQATIFESAAATSRNVHQPSPADQHSHASAPTKSDGNEIVGSNLIQSQLTAITKLLEVQSQNRLPLPEPGMFSGDHLKYPTWIRAFESLVESRATKPSDRLYFLSRYVSGEAKEVIQGFMLMEGDDAYQKAKEVLHKRYGDSFAVAAAFRKKLDAWPHIAPFDSLGLRRYADFLVQCEKAMEKVGSLRVLNDDQENQKMSLKLPKWASTRWGRKVYQWKKEKCEFPPFSEFVKYVVMEADIVCDPVNCRQRKTEEESKGLRNKRDNRLPHGRSGTDPSRTLATRTKNDDSEEHERWAKICVLCNGKHELESCLEYKKMDVKARKEFAKTKGLCFGCLGRGHLSRECKKRKKCGTCGKFHPTSLHGDYKNVPKETKQEEANTPLEEQTVHCTKSSDENSESQAQISSMIVPVWLRHRDNPEREVLVYALLDDQSDTTFVSQSALDNIGAKGPETQLSLSTMHADNEIIQSHRVDGLVIDDLQRGTQIKLPRTFTCTSIPARRSQIPRPEMADKWPHLANVASDIAVYHHDVEVALLIGANCPQAIMPRQVIPGRWNEPYAQLTNLGWGIVGNVDESYRGEEDVEGVVHRTVTRVPESSKRGCTFAIKRTVKELINPQQVRQMMELDFSEGGKPTQPLSIDDRKFLKQLQEGVHQTNNRHYEMPLPFRESLPELPNNKLQAMRRLERLKCRLKKDEKYRRHYFTVMNELIKRGYAERVPEHELSNESETAWYIPHHGIYHPQKPDKLRVVFDCSASYHGESLNNHLLQGPDLTNGLLGVLCRFRLGPIAFSCDVEAMFHQFKVDSAHRNYLRFLWWENGDITSSPKEFRMTVHLFGATSSPGCANFGLKKIAEDNESKYGTEVANFIKRDFYVDDGLKSMATVPEAVSLIHNAKDMLAEGGLRLHKFVSNSKEVLKTVAPEDRTPHLKNLDFTEDHLPIERTLGTQWCIESDSFQFRITLQDKPFTRRGILSTVSSIFDPFGFVAPLLLVGKRILQDLCREKADWDDPVPEDVKRRWEKWRDELLHLNKLKVQRCLTPAGFERTKSMELHHFSDASTTGYGQSSYLRIVNENDEVHCAFVIGKARVSPLRPITIPRLELTAALVSVKVSCMLQEELDFDDITHVFWTDSKVVLGYIGNDARRFHVFVANRVQQIRENTSPDQWKYVETENNPADDASRGLSAQQLNESCRWLKGPEFLWQPELPSTVVERWIPTPNDPEVKKVKSFATQATTARLPSLVSRLEYFSCWHRAKRAVANCKRLMRRLKNPEMKDAKNRAPTRQIHQKYKVNVDDLTNAEDTILRHVQEEAFPDELKILRAHTHNTADRAEVSKLKATMKKTSCLYRLDPFLDPNGILRVGGRIKRADVPYHLKHPIILPRKGHVTTLVMRYYHRRAGHPGRGITLNELRSNGYWIIGGSSAVGYHITSCVQCHRLRGSVQDQKMADLPSDRLHPAPPFTYCAVDYFGPWYIKEGRKVLKRYGVLFTCLASRAVHLEVAKTLETDSFINVLRCFLARRGPVRQLRSDQGTNLVGAKGELKETLEKMDNVEVQNFLLKKECDWIEFKLNTPTASHAGGVWERMIRTVRNALNGLLEEHGTQLDEESLRTLMCEAEAIVNSRPMAPPGTNVPEEEPLTPNHLLTMKSRVLLPPPGEFQRADMYLIKRWKRVQYLVNQFGDRWRKGFLLALQERQKWNVPRRNLQPGDVVLLKDDSTARNQWRSARVEETYMDEDGLVRGVRVLVGDAHLNEKGERIRAKSVLERPIQKLVLLWKAES